MTFTKFVLPIENRELTPRELEVACLIASDYTNRQIREKLCLSRNTVNIHIGHIRRKLNIWTRVGIALWYFDKYGYHPLRK